MHDQHIYKEDLARIHVEGFGFHWEQAADPVLKILRKAGIRRGLVVDLGCGGGQWLAYLHERGYDVCGIDVSRSMIRSARRRVRGGRFVLDSFCKVAIPRCDVVTSLGEPINYLTGKPEIQRTFRRVFDALRPGGLFVFDAREPNLKRTKPMTISRVGDDWACIATIHEHGRRNMIVREITTFLKVGATYRRRHEIHRLKVYCYQQTMDWLRSCGFTVRRYRGYGNYRLTPYQSVYVARKPTQ